MSHNGNANKMVSETPRTDAVARINEYLGVGGLFNPEILNVQQHEAVRDTLIQARDELNAANERIKRLEEWKRSALEVEREWDANAIATMLGGRQGECQRKVVQREVPKLLDLIKRLKREVEVLRLYGNKDCTAMADEALEKETNP